MILCLNVLLVRLFTSVAPAAREVVTVRIKLAYFSCGQDARCSSTFKKVPSMPAGINAKRR